MGLRQAELARKVGISASYLNLIENNHRPIAGKLLGALAVALGTDPAHLSAAMSPEMRDNLGQAAHVAGQDASDLEAFAFRYPAWAQTICVQQARIAELDRALQALDDTLTHDPVLSEAMHDVLSTVSAIRATAAILVDTPTLDVDWRNRFHSNIDSESRRLAQSTKVMAAQLDRSARKDGDSVTGAEAVARFVEAHHHHFDALETQGRDAMASVLAMSGLEDQGTRGMLETVLLAYAGRAARLPLARFETVLAQLGYGDPGAIARALDLPLAVVLERFGDLPMTPARPDIGLASCDGAGAILRCRQTRGFHGPTQAAACALWPLFAALNSPGVAIRRRVTLEDDRVFVAFALAGPSDASRFETPVIQSTMVLIADEGPLDPAHAPPLEVGITCRTCARDTCAARRVPSVVTTH